MVSKKGKVGLGLLLAASTCSPSQASADTEHPNFIRWDLMESWSYEQEYDWLEQSRTVKLLQFWLDIEEDGVYGRQTHLRHRQKAMERNISVRLYSTVSPDATFKAEVEQWRSTVEAAILANGGPLSDTARFLSIINCESGGDPSAYNRASTASGLMQHLANYWDARSRTALGYVADPFDGEANIRVSAWLIYKATGGGWQHWVCV